MCENVQNCCRICLDVESDHVPIFGDSAIHLQIKSCLAMTISSHDILPKTICSTCIGKLNEFYNFQLNARCSQDWLESSLEEQVKKSVESKLPIQPLPDSEYNSDSLLEFLNNTANIEEYLNNLGKEDIPCIVNMLDRNQENSLDSNKGIKVTKQSPKKKEAAKNKGCINMEIDVLDSDIDIVKELLMRETEPKKLNLVKEKNIFTCFGCKLKFENLQKLSQHLSTCDMALRTCTHCNLLFDSKHKMHQHYITHSNLPLTCNCGKHFSSKAHLAQHMKVCTVDFSASMGCVYRCKQCKETFKERFQLYKHAKEHVKKENMRICDLCGLSFDGNEALLKHRKEAHEEIKNQLYRCKVCHHTSSDRKKIYDHIQKYCLLTKKQPDRHLCDSCGKSFTTKATLLNHIQQHATERCSICSKTFTNVKLRDEHVLEHKEMTICEKCGLNVCSVKINGHSCL